MSRYRPSANDLMTLLPTTIARFEKGVTPLQMNLSPEEAIVVCTALGLLNEKLWFRLEEAKRLPKETAEQIVASDTALRAEMGSLLLCQKVYERLVKLQSRLGWVNCTLDEAKVRGAKIVDQKQDH